MNQTNAIPKENEHLTDKHESAVAVISDVVNDTLIRLQDASVAPYRKRIDDLEKALVEVVKKSGEQREHLLGLLRTAREWGMNSKGYDASLCRKTTEEIDSILIPSGEAGKG